MALRQVDLKIRHPETILLLRAGQSRANEFPAFGLRLHQLLRRDVGAVNILHGRLVQTQPLIYLNSTAVDVRPVVLNEGERDFVLDLKAFYEKDHAFFEGKELYLLRNLSRGRSIGFQGGFKKS